MLKNTLKQLRTDAGLTQEELSKKLGISRSAWSLYELGIREPDYTILKSIAQFFNVSSDFLLGVPQEMDSKEHAAALKVEILSEFSLRLSKLRSERHLSTQQLANDVQIPQQNIIEFENSLRLPDFGIITRLSNYFHVVPNYLIGTTNDPNSNDDEYIKSLEIGELSDESREELRKYANLLQIKEKVEKNALDEKSSALNGTE